MPEPDIRKSNLPYQINLVSFIASIADFYDALSTARPYKKAIPPARVVEFMQDLQDKKLEPRLCKVFLDMVGRYPIGSVVKLDSGELGVVSMQNEDDPLRPEVHLVTEPDGRKLSESAGVSLAESKDGSFIRSIVESVDPLDAEIDPIEVLQNVLHNQFVKAHPQVEENVQI